MKETLTCPAALTERAEGGGGAYLSHLIQQQALSCGETMVQGLLLPRGWKRIVPTSQAPAIL